MAFIKGIAAGAAGAAMYNLYHESDGAFAGKDLASGMVEVFQRRGAHQMTELTRMQRQVEDLQSALLKSLHEKGQPAVIVQGGSGRGSGNVVLGVVVLAGGVALYLRFVRGWRLGDLMYVTKGALASMQQTVNQGLANMRCQVEAATADLLVRLGAVSDKQDDMLERQADMDGHLRDVSGRVIEVQGGVALLQDQMAYSNNAITLLCGAMSEVAKRVGLNNGRYVRALDGMVHSGNLLGMSGQQQQQQLVLNDGTPIRSLLPGVEDVVPFDAPAAASSAAAMPDVRSTGNAMPRPNPAVYALSGASSSSGRVAPPVGAHVSTRSQPGPLMDFGAHGFKGTTPGSSNGSGGSSIDGSHQQPRWGRSVSEIVGSTFASKHE